jgi:sec-independent protein translocase protein TatA
MNEYMLAMIGWTEVLIIALVVLILFGSSKIPQFMRGLGQGMGEFKKGIREGDEKVEKDRRGTVGK